MTEQLSKLSLEQLTTLLLASRENIIISDLCDYRFSLEQLDLLIQYRKLGIDISMIANPLISYDNMKILIEVIEKGMFTPELASPNLDKDKLILLIEAHYAGVNISGLSNPYIEFDVLKKLVELRSQNDKRVNTSINNMTPAEVEVLLCGKLDRVTEVYKEEIIDELQQHIVDNSNKEGTISRGKIYQIYKKNTFVE